MQSWLRDRKGTWVHEMSWSRDAVMHLGSFNGSLQDGKKNRCLVNRSLLCPIGGSKEVISDHLLLWPRLLIQFAFLGN